MIWGENVGMKYVPKKSPHSNHFISFGICLFHLSRVRAHIHVNRVCVFLICPFDQFMNIHFVVNIYLRICHVRLL